MPFKDQFKLFFFSGLLLWFDIVAAGISLPAGSQITMGQGVINLGCSDMAIAGALNLQQGRIQRVDNFTNTATGQVNAGNGVLRLAGDWTNSGSFIADTSLVHISDDCGRTSSSLVGDTEFARFRVDSVLGKTLFSEAGSTHRFSQRLMLTGISHVPLLIRSTITGVQTHFVLGPLATQNIFAVDVSDNNASGGSRLAPVVASTIQSRDSGNNTNWFRSAVPVPVFNRWTLMIMILLLLMTAGANAVNSPANKR